MSLQESCSPIMEQLIFFHDHSFLIILMITILVTYIMTSLFTNKIINRFILEHQMIETIWTIIPGVILIFIALPSLRLLYLLDETKNPSITLKTVGHQWYWSYEYSDFLNIEFDSFMIPTTDNLTSDFRLLEVNNRTILPFKTQIRLLVTAADVLHSWTVPSLGVKVDANPGRLNQMSFYMTRPGIFFGQCSEICGSVHSFMPIVIESISKSSFIHWLSTN
uniref:Cytochrome c oxidase subunit 2 n=1 Tax=Lepinotus reticulatus TaxID=209981 RepID=A0A3S8IEB5_9NEOP|nr:cytochrome c oxidase subunit II [Lepinotus reticulatus]